MIKNRYNSFDGLRSIGAIGILVMHYRANLPAMMKESLVRDCHFLYEVIVPFLTNFVYMFFIVSAFSMCCGYFHCFDTIENKDGRNYSGFDTEKFYVKRYSRIWPFFAILVCIDCVLKPSVSELYQAFADLTLAFNLLPNPQIDVIGVGWFLGVVFLFYMIFPWFAFLLQNKKRAWFAMLISVLFHIVLVRYFLTSEFCTNSQIDAPRHNIIYSFPFFMAGGLIYLYRDKLTKAYWCRYLYLVLAIITTSLQLSPYRPEPLGENIFWIELTFILWVLYAMTGGIVIMGKKLLDNRIAKFLGGLSMEIYLCHMVMFRVLEKLHFENVFDNYHLAFWVMCLCGLILSVAFSWLMTKMIFPALGRLGKH